MATAVLTTPTTGRARGFRLGPLAPSGLVGVVAVTVGYLVLSAPRFLDPYVIDEAVFPYVAHGILLHGAPVFYNGELRPTDIGLWHPPLYDYLLAGFVGAFGFSPITVRAFGALCVIVAVAILIPTLRRIAPATPQLGYVALAALVMLNPLVVSGALVPDIDGTLGVPVVAAGLWCAVRVAQDRLTWGLAGIVAGYATLVVDTKFTIAGFVAVIVGVGALLSRTQRWRKLAATVGAFAVGTALALGLLFATGALVGFDARLPFDYLFGSLQSRTPGRGGLSGALDSLFAGPGATVVWIGPALIVAAVVAAVVVPWRRPDGVDARLVVLAASGGAFIVVGYAVISASPFQFPKYTPIAVPALALAATTLLTLVPAGLVASVSRRRATIVLGAYAAVLLVGTVGVTILARRSERVDGRTLTDTTPLYLAALAAVAVATVIAALLLRPRADTRRRTTAVVASSVVVALIATTVLTNVAADAVNAVAPYATRYYYGERGMAAFLAEADARIPEGTAVIAAKDVGLQLDRPFYEDAILLNGSVGDFRTFLDTHDVPYVVTRRLHDYSEPVYPEHFAVLKELYRPILDDPSEDFVLWQRITD